MNKLKKTLANPFFYLLIFVLFNWILLFPVTKLAPPDFYKYYFAGERLIKGSMNLRFIPPLFPFSLYIFGKFLSLFLSSYNPFITASKLLSLFAGLGIIFFSYKFLREYTGSFSLLGTVFIIISPFFLKFLSFPSTDIVFLFFVMASFYFFLAKKDFLLFFSVLLGALTRYEGILLIMILFIYFFDFKKAKNYFKLLLFLVVSAPIVYLFYYKFGHRFVQKVELVTQTKSFLFFIYHPKQLFYIVYSGILNFIPNKTPVLFHWVVLYFLIVFLIIGLLLLFRNNLKLAVSILLYELIFAFGKGYIFGNSYAIIPGEHNLRRFLSFVFVFYLLSFVGLYGLLRYLRKSLGDKEFVFLRYFIYFILGVLVFSRFLITAKFILISLIFILPLLLIFLRSLKFGKIEKAILIILLFSFFTNYYFKTYKKGYKYIYSTPNKGAYAIAEWINNNSTLKKAAVFSNLIMIRFYLKRNINMLYFYSKEESIYKDRKKLEVFIVGELKKQKTRYVAFDWYLNPIDRPGEVELKKFLFKEIKEQENFILKEGLIFKSQPVAAVLCLR